MVTIVVKKLDRNNKVSGRKAVSEKRARSSDGKVTRTYTIDAASPTFELDLTAVYQANVASARTENSRLFGSADGFLKSSSRPKSGGRLHVRRKK